jgi:hypothetical protein
VRVEIGEHQLAVTRLRTYALGHVVADRCEALDRVGEHRVDRRRRL